ncbi:MAG: anhydro-N-acetylmuramic acid kinase, partial [Phycisphaeraceae bacterium]
MTGTSLDGLDAALVEVGGEGLDITAQFVGMVSRPLGGLRDELHGFATGQSAEPIRYLLAARQLGELHADAVAELCEQYPDTKPDFVVAHGQTIWHAPREHLSWQLFDPWPIVRQLSVPVLYDLRQADLIAGGQGAPITPLADWVMYRDRADLVINLGGICNVTKLIGEPVGFDLGPCNLLIDGAVRCLFPETAFDKDGELAASGRTDPTIFRPLFDDLPDDHNGIPRSLGREDVLDDRIATLVNQALENHSANDIIASAVKSVADRVIQSVAGLGPRKVVLAGGGANNPVLVDLIRQGCSPESGVVLSDELGVPVEAREAMGMAVLGALTQDSVPITLPQVTGARQPGCAGA